MCGRIVTIIPAEELAKIFSLIEVPQLEPRFNVAPTQNVGIIRSVTDSEHNRLDFLKWGFVPSWSKDSSAASHMINARCETVAEKPSFRDAIKYSRCIIPISGFYEWSHEGNEKRPHYIHLANHVPIGLAGIWGRWNAPDGTGLETFSILTTSANKLVSKLHERMPVILHPDNYELWLNRNMHDTHMLEKLYSPFPDELMTYYEVPSLVNNPCFDSPACIAKV
jgi:putative SOS response-associated peptidase YedK